MKQIFAAIFAVLTLSCAAAARAQNAPDIVGAWAMTTSSPQGENTNTMVVTREGETLKAVAKSDRGERPYDSISLSGDTVTIVMTISFSGAPMTITYTGKLSGTSMTGDADFGGMAQGSWSAAKQ
jgi:hypothetical protein